MKLHILFRHTSLLSIMLLSITNHSAMASTAKLMWAGTGHTVNGSDQVSADKKPAKEVGEASYNIEDCSDADADDSSADEDEDSATQPKDLDECKPATK